MFRPERVRSNADRLMHLLIQLDRGPPVKPDLQTCPLTAWTALLAIQWLFLGTTVPRCLPKYTVLDIALYISEEL